MPMGQEKWSKEIERTACEDPTLEIEMRRILLAALAVTVLAACQPVTTEFTEEQKSEIATEVNALHTEFMNVMEAAEFDRGMSYFLNSQEFIFANDGVLFAGYDVVYDAFQPAFANMENQTFRTIESHTTVLAPDVVHVLQLGTFIQHYTSGEDGPEAQFVVSVIWVRQNGEWKGHFGHQSTPNSEAP
jgi:ketosteroid isomerase-like protein